MSKEEERDEWLSQAHPSSTAWKKRLPVIYAVYTAVASFIDSRHVTGLRTALMVLTLAILLFGVTMGARIPRLAKRRAKSVTQSLGLFLLCCLPLFALALFGTAPVLMRIASLAGTHFPVLQSPLAAATVVAALALLTALSGTLARREPRCGRRWLLFIGCLVVAVLVGVAASAPPLHTQASGLPAEPRGVWPVALAGAIFLYSWWLGILTFDLSFIWHRYIRAQVDLIQRMTHWRWPIRKGATPPGTVT